ncbi:MAG TPA: hypothetical protein VIV60_21260 [Polyangiaceae bacterium]
MLVPGHHLASIEPFRVGVSYWPRQAGFNLWKQFDVDEVHEDFSIMSEMGINLARVALLWEDFQPQPDALRCSALAHLLELCDAAASEGIRLELLLFAGPIGNPKAFPSWLRENDTEPCCTLVNPFSNPLAKRGAEAFVRGIARTVGNHSAIWAYNLGDRPDRLAKSSCRVAANAWFDELSQIIHSVDKRHPVTCSLAGANLSTNATLRVDQVFSVLDHSTMDRDGLSAATGNTDARALAIFGCALTTALSGKPCLLQSDWDSSSVSDANTEGLGADAPEGIAARMLLNGLYEVGALGAIIGTFTDLPDEMQIRSGLVDADGRMRPHAAAIQEFVGTKPRVQKPSGKSIALGMSADEFYEHPDTNLRRLFGEFLRQ